MFIGNGEAILGDCLDAMKLIPDGSIDLTVTSPPYDNLRTYKGNLQWDFEGIAKQLYRVTKEGGVVVWIVGDATVKGSETGTSFKQALFFKEIGFNLHDTMIWSKKNPLPNDPEQNRYIQKIEFMFVFSKGKPIMCNYITEDCIMAGIIAGTGTARKPNGEIRLDRKEKRKGKAVKEKKPLSNIWEYSNGNLFKQHPATFPEKLAQDHILSWSNEGDTILDPFAGSFTTAKMAELNNRKWIMIEKEEDYFDIGINRLNLCFQK